jgi:hypothetical protein
MTRLNVTKTLLRIFLRPVHTFWLKFTPKGNLKCSSRYTSDYCSKMFLQCMRSLATKEEYLYLPKYKFWISRIKKWICCCYVPCIFSVVMVTENYFHIRIYFCVVLCIFLCCSVYCLCVNVYCTTATGCQPNCS